MKRKPRWMVIAVMAVFVMSCLPGQISAQSGPLRLPEGGDTIGDPDMPGGSTKLILGRNLREPRVPLLVQAGGYFLLLPVSTTFVRVRPMERSGSTQRVGKR
jgi:hypothetical protein